MVLLLRFSLAQWTDPVSYIALPPSLGHSQSLAEAYFNLWTGNTKRALGCASLEFEYPRSSIPMGLPSERLHEVWRTMPYSSCFPCVPTSFIPVPGIAGTTNFILELAPGEAGLDKPIISFFLYHNLWTRTSVLVTISHQPCVCVCVYTAHCKQRMAYMLHAKDTYTLQAYVLYNI